MGVGGNRQQAIALFEKIIPTHRFLFEGRRAGCGKNVLNVIYARCPEASIISKIDILRE